MPNYTSERSEEVDHYVHHYNDSKLNEHRLDEFKVRLFKLEATLKQKDEQIYTLKNINQPFTMQNIIMFKKILPTLLRALLQIYPLLSGLC